MSLLGKVGKFLGKAVKTVAPIIPGPVGAIARVATGVAGVAGAVGAVRSALPPPPSLPRIPTAQSGMISGLPMIRAAGRALPGAGAVATTVGSTVRRLAPTVALWTRRAAAAAGLYVVGREVYDSLGNHKGRLRKHRTMNPMNVKAARRAIRRVKAARKICHEIESHLPKAKSRGRCPPKRGKC